MVNLKNRINELIQFFKSAYMELKKVSWLSKKELISSTIVIIIFIFIIAIFVGIVDFILARILGIFIGGRL